MNIQDVTLLVKDPRFREIVRGENCYIGALFVLHKCNILIWLSRGIKELLKMFRSLPDNDGAGAAKQHAKGEEWAARPGMLSEVVEDEEGGEHEDEGEHLKSREGTEESELSLVVRHPEERSASQNKS